MKNLRLLTLLVCAGGVLGFGSAFAQVSEREPVPVPTSPSATQPYEQAPVEFLDAAPTGGSTQTQTPRTSTRTSTRRSSTRVRSR